MKNRKDGRFVNPDPADEGREIKRDGRQATERAWFQSRARRASVDADDFPDAPKVDPLAPRPPSARAGKCIRCRRGDAAALGLCVGCAMGKGRK